MYEMGYFPFEKEILGYPAYNPEKWATRKEWFDELYAAGYYWITDKYDENGEPCSKVGAKTALDR